jgi:hypothetical protein
MGKLALLSAILGGTICAGPIGTYTFTGTAAGTLNGTPFASETLTIVLVGDTSTIVQSPADVFTLTVGPNVSTFNLAGALASSGTFSDSTYAFDNQVNGADGEAGFGTLGVDDDINTFGLSPVFATYSLTTSLGPLGPRGIGRRRAFFYTDLGGYAGCHVVR